MIGDNYIEVVSPVVGRWVAVAVVEVREGTPGPCERIANPSREPARLFLQEESYGVEFFLQKQAGRFTGWIGYTLAWTWRTFPDLNNGNRYPPTHDRRNDFNVVVTYHANDRWTLGGTFTYGTGQAYTQIAALAPNVEDPAREIPVEGDKNALRLPPYNRMDLSATYSFGFFSDKRNAE